VHHKVESAAPCWQTYICMNLTDTWNATRLSQKERKQSDAKEGAEISPLPGMPTMVLCFVTEINTKPRKCGMIYINSSSMTYAWNYPKKKQKSGIPTRDQTP